MSRSIFDVIQQIKDSLPLGAFQLDIKNKGDLTLEQELALVQALDKLQYSAAYTAPEDMRRHWVVLSELLTNHLGQPDTEWKMNIVKIMAGDKK